jgi:hypothetical protein
MPGENARTPAELVDHAIDRFSAGDDEGFTACFDTDAMVWADPQLVQGVVLSGREQILAWCLEARRRWSDVLFAHGELSNHGIGAYVELDVLTANRTAGGAWRLCLAVFVRDGLVIEVLPQPDRSTALGVLGSH